MYSSLRYVSFRAVLKNSSRDVKAWNVLSLDTSLGSDDAIAIFSCAIRHCERLSKLCIGGNLEYYCLSRWNEILVVKEYPYDPVGDIILDYQELCHIKVQRLRQYTEDDWNELQAVTDNYDDDDVYYELA